MTCNMESNPKPTVEWFKGSETVKQGGRISIRTDKGAADDTYALVCEIGVRLTDVLMMW